MFSYWHNLTNKNIVPYIKPALIGATVGGIAGAYSGTIIGANNAGGHGVEGAQIGGTIGIVGGAALGIGTVKAASNFASSAVNTLQSIGGGAISGFEKSQSLGQQKIFLIKFYEKVMMKENRPLFIAFSFRFYTKEDKNHG